MEKSQATWKHISEILREFGHDKKVLTSTIKDIIRLFKSKERCQFVNETEYLDFCHKDN